MGLPERAPAHGGTLGRAATRQTQAVRRAEVGESARARSPVRGAQRAPAKASILTD